MASGQGYGTSSSTSKEIHISPEEAQEIVSVQELADLVNGIGDCVQLPYLLLKLGFSAGTGITILELLKQKQHDRKGLHDIFVDAKYEELARIALGAESILGNDLDKIAPIIDEFPPATRLVLELNLDNKTITKNVIMAALQRSSVKKTEDILKEWLNRLKEDKRSTLEAVLENAHFTEVKERVLVNGDVSTAEVEKLSKKIGECTPATVMVMELCSTCTGLLKHVRRTGKTAEINTCSLLEEWVAKPEQPNACHRSVLKAALNKAERFDLATDLERISSDEVVSLSREIHALGGLTSSTLLAIELGLNVREVRQYMGQGVSDLLREKQITHRSVLRERLQKAGLQTLSEKYLTYETVSEEEVRGLAKALGKCNHATLLVLQLRLTGDDIRHHVIESHDGTHADDCISTVGLLEAWAEKTPLNQRSCLHEFLQRAGFGEMEKHHSQHETPPRKNGSQGVSSGTRSNKKHWKGQDSKKPPYTLRSSTTNTFDTSGNAAYADLPNEKMSKEELKEKAKVIGNCGLATLLFAELNLNYTHVLDRKGSEGAITMKSTETVLIEWMNNTDNGHRSKLLRALGNSHLQDIGTKYLANESVSDGELASLSTAIGQFTEATVFFVAMGIKSTSLVELRKMKNDQQDTIRIIRELVSKTHSHQRSELRSKLSGSAVGLSHIANKCLRDGLLLEEVHQVADDIGYSSMAAPLFIELGFESGDLRRSGMQGGLKNTATLLSEWIAKEKRKHRTKLKGAPENSGRIKLRIALENSGLSQAAKACLEDVSNDELQNIAKETGHCSRNSLVLLKLNSEGGSVIKTVRNTEGTKMPPTEKLLREWRASSQRQRSTLHDILKDWNVKRILDKGTVTDNEISYLHDAIVGSMKPTESTKSTRLVIELGYSESSRLRPYVNILQTSDKRSVSIANVTLFRHWTGEQCDEKRSKLRIKLREYGYRQVAYRCLGPDPLEVLSTGPEGKKAINEAKQKKYTPTNRGRLVLLGPKGVGKTSLMETLCGKKQTLEGNGKQLRAEVSVTCGKQTWNIKDDEQVREAIEAEYNDGVASAALKTLQHELELKGKKVSDKVIDRARKVTPSRMRGKKNIPERLQEMIASRHDNKRSPDYTVSLDIVDLEANGIYYTAHQIFLTWSTIHLIVFDLSKPLDTKQGLGSQMCTSLEWINVCLASIHDHASFPYGTSGKERKKPVVFMVGTHRNTATRNVINDIRRSLKDKPYHYLVEDPSLYFAVENEVDSELVKLRRKIIDCVKETEPIEIPLRWRMFELNTFDKGNFVGNIGELESTSYLGEKDQTDMLSFYHAAGRIYHCQSEPHDFILMNFQKFMHVAKGVVEEVTSMPQMSSPQHGLISRDRLSYLLKKLSRNLPDHWLNYLLHMMEYFGFLIKRRDSYLLLDCMKTAETSTEVHVPNPISTVVLFANHRDMFSPRWFCHLYERVHELVPEEPELECCGAASWIVENNRIDVNISRPANEIKISISSKSSMHGEGNHQPPDGNVVRKVEMRLKEILREFCKAANTVNYDLSTNCLTGGCREIISLPDSECSRGRNQEFCRSHHRNNVDDVLVRLGQRRKISISVCSSAQEVNVGGLITFLNQKKQDAHLMIREVKFHTLPYNNLEAHTFSEQDPMDIMIVCHSINNRRFAITDVLDALYNEYLPYCKKVLGIHKVAVIAHDFDDMSETVNEARMMSFRHRQPTAFKTSSLAFTCGQLSGKPAILKADEEALFDFLERASHCQESMNLDDKVYTFYVPSGNKAVKGNLVEKERNVPDSTSSASASMLSCKPPKTSSIPQGGTQESSEVTIEPTTGMALKREEKTWQRQLTITICTMSKEDDVGRLLVYLKNKQKGNPQMIKNIIFNRLPEKKLHSFQFPEKEPHDVMLLCHFIKKRGTSLSIYNSFLSNCGKLFGKNKIAVIAHNFDKSVRTEEIQISCCPVIVCGKLQKGKTETIELENLEKFLIEASLQPEMAATCSQQHGSSLVSRLGSITTGNRDRPEDQAPLDKPKSPSVKGERESSGFLSRMWRSSDSDVTRAAERSSASSQGTKRESQKDSSVVSVQKTFPEEGARQNLSKEGAAPRPSQTMLPSGVSSSSSYHNPERSPSPTIVVCTSSHEENVQGFIKKVVGEPRLTEVVGHVQYQHLPYSDLDSFTFPSKKQSDIMVLCHSIHNRGFAITDVMGSIYNRYLHYCSTAFRKTNIAVIVYDFPKKDITPDMVEIRMDSFKLRQPTTFKLADTVIIAGNLEIESDVLDGDWNRFIAFCKRANRRI